MGSTSSALLYTHGTLAEVGTSAPAVKFQRFVRQGIADHVEQCSDADASVEHLDHFFDTEPCPFPSSGEPFNSA
jgi:hypothetical protein